MAKRYLLKSEIQRVKAKHPPFELVLEEVRGSDDSVLYESKVVLVPAAANLPDDVVEASTVAPVAAARMILGDDYEQFKLAGGSAGLLLNMIRDNEGVAELGE